MATRTRILITGGSGFLGRHLALRLRDGHEVVLAARNDSANAAAEKATGCTAVALDVAQIESVRDIVREVRPHLIVHAAATKHVGACERQPLLCVDVNVGGSQNVARVAIEHDVEGVVGISSDKATPPASTTYGATKALMERLWCALDDRGDTRFTCVRLGNIAWSTGSVLCEWERMARDDGVIRTTGRAMHRYFLSADEAASTVEAAWRHIDVTRGAVVVPELQTVSIGDLLEVFAAQRGVGWVDAPRRPHDADDELLIAADELGGARRVRFDGREHLIFRPGAAAEKSPGNPPSSATAERMAPGRIEQLARPPIAAAQMSHPSVVRSPPP